MNRIEATYQITTPMFIGDAMQEASGISPASVKGALRFWWRALHWGWVRNGKQDDAGAFKELHVAESQLFGSAADKGVGQGQFLLRVAVEKSQRGKPLNSGTGMQYLAGIGLFHFRDGFTRDSIQSGKFTIHIVLKPSITLVQKKQLLDALKAFGLLGGLGARARRGLGSVSISGLIVDGDRQPVPQDIAEFKSEIARLLEGGAATRPPFSGMSAESRIDISQSGNNAHKLLESAGSEMQLYRSFGRHGKVNGRQSERNFVDDHDDVLRVGEGKRMSSLPKRSVFGLPHNYFFSSSGNFKVDIAPDGNGRGRRASPLMLHVHEFPNGGGAILVQSVLRAKFLPNREPVYFKASRRGSFNLGFKDDQIDWDVLTNYLDRFVDRQTITGVGL
ncbi:MAG: type III-B CRISPR module RAMP protein Cmr1 [Gammaproteobacteria bacterium]|nr:type III-B CRISPR module RAMP protein Cmr1 [Gammaproteobacteria bacterium]